MVREMVRVVLAIAWLPLPALWASGQVLSGEVAEQLERSAEAAYKYQRTAKLRLHPGLAELLALPRWPCFWGEEYTSDLTEGRGDGGYGYRTCGLRQWGRPAGGVAADGAAATAVAAAAADPCIVYSFGSDGDYEFERAVVRQRGSRCEIHIFDLHEDKGLDAAFDDLGMEVNVHYHRMAILDHDGLEAVQLWPHAQPTRVYASTLPSIIEILGHSHISVLKIDIEGHEHRVFAHLAERGWPVVPGQVYMEVPNVVLAIVFHPPALATRASIIHAHSGCALVGAGLRCPHRVLCSRLQLLGERLRWRPEPRFPVAPKRVLVARPAAIGQPRCSLFAHLVWPEHRQRSALARVLFLRAGRQRHG
mmetsp:Transcript_142358/g.454238  ORF Transcript_142358/g.454238 Transcript_142358/m.454238 type:complete len:363 (+) Transcript_142358:60-1148(+)